MKILMIYLINYLSSFGRGRSARWVAVAAFSTALVACGGGGGGGSGASTPPSTPIGITAANAESVGTAALIGALGLSSSSALVAVDTSTGATVPPRTISRISAGAAMHARAYLGSPQSLTGVVQTFPCGISGDFTVNAADDGTSLTITFNACSDFAGEVVNGSVSMTGITGTATAFSATFSINLTYSVTGFPDANIAGSYSISFTYSGFDWTSTVSGSSFSITEGSSSTTLSSFTFSDSYVNTSQIYSTSGNYTIASTDIGGSVTVQTNTPIQQYAYRIRPFAGQITVTGTGNSRVRVTILGDETNAGNDVRFEIDENGDSAYETTIERDWSALPI
jgi:hypothetical protein